MQNKLCLTRISFELDQDPRRPGGVIERRKSDLCSRFNILSYVLPPPACRGQPLVCFGGSLRWSLQEVQAVALQWMFAEHLSAPCLVVQINLNLFQLLFGFGCLGGEASFIHE